jgi:hypothetical protein
MENYSVILDIIEYNTLYAEVTKIGAITDASNQVN